MAGTKRKFGDGKGQTTSDSREVKRREISRKLPFEKLSHRTGGDEYREDFAEDDEFGGFSESEDNISERAKLHRKPPSTLKARKSATATSKNQTKSEGANPKGIISGLPTIYEFAKRP